MENSDAYEKKLKAEHGNAIFYEDRGIIEMDGVDVDFQPCEAMDYKLSRICTDAGIYRVRGNYRDRQKGARVKRFQRNLCAKHMAEWASLHGTTVTELLAKGD